MEVSFVTKEWTNPHTPEQNGLAERFNRRIIEQARCLLFDADFTKEFWAEAVGAAVYLRNRTVTSSQINKTPYELWTGRKPDISNCIIYGSKVMVHIPKKNSKKMG